MDVVENNNKIIIKLKKIDKIIAAIVDAANGQATAYSKPQPKNRPVIAKNGTIIGNISVKENKSLHSLYIVTKEFATVLNPSIRANLKPNPVSSNMSPKNCVNINHLVSSSISVLPPSLPRPIK